MGTNIPNTPSEQLQGTSSVISPAGAILPWYRPGNYYPRPLRSMGPGGIAGSGISNPAYPPQTGRPGGNNLSAGLGPGSVASNAGSNGNNAPMGSGLFSSQAIAANPFSFTKSPVPMLLIFLVISILLLRFVHYGY